MNLFPRSSEVPAASRDSSFDQPDTSEQFDRRNAEVGTKWRTNWPKWLLLGAVIGLMVQIVRLIPTGFLEALDVRKWSSLDFFLANLIAVLILISVRFWPDKRPK